MTVVSDAAPAASRLLAGYSPDTSFFFASPRATLLAEGTYFAVPPSVRPAGLGDLPDRVAAVLAVARAAGHDDPVVVGAVPFDHAAPARLAVPQRVHRAGRLGAPAAPDPPPNLGTPEPVPSPDAYADAVRIAISRIRSGHDGGAGHDGGGGRLDKVVLARTLRLAAREPAAVGPLLASLAGRDPAGYTFAAGLGAGRVLLGASPELLVSRSGRRVVANPLAGSAARSADPAEDRRRAETLLASAKDRHEHAVVVDAVAAGLRPLCTNLRVPAEPSLVRTATMWHLSTRVTGESDASALALAAALHPTPAVCGAPPDAARAAIAELEPFDRGFYTGMVGWGDERGDGEWVVTIRCAVAEPGGLRLYAGAGIVADSDAEVELAETTAKFQTLLRALGLADVA